MIPRTKSAEEEFRKILDEKTKDFNEKLDEISTKLASKPREEKIENIIQKMKDRVPEKIIRGNIEKPIEKPVEKPVEKHSHDDILCPSCSKGHVHKMESSGLKMKCTDGNCGEELFIIPKSADHSCTNCGFPIKKPADEKILDGCPFCGNTSAQQFNDGKPEIKFDFSKMKK